jgi:hypothetical protein
VVPIYDESDGFHGIDGNDRKFIYLHPKKDTLKVMGKYGVTSWQLITPNMLMFFKRIYRRYQRGLTLTFGAHQSALWHKLAFPHPFIRELVACCECAQTILFIIPSLHDTCVPSEQKFGGPRPFEIEETTAMAENLAHDWSSGVARTYTADYWCAPYAYRDVRFKGVGLYNGLE